jgi:hypothetical protein
MKLSTMIFASAVIAASTLAHSQNVPSARSINIPFAFCAQGAKLPAGRYLMWYDQGRRVWEFRTYAHVDVELKPIPQKHSPIGQRDILLFNRVGDNYSLMEIQEAGMPVSRIAPATDREELASAHGPQLATTSR